MSILTLPMTIIPLGLGLRRSDSQSRNMIPARIRTPDRVWVAAIVVAAPPPPELGACAVWVGSHHVSLLPNSGRTKGGTHIVMFETDDQLCPASRQGGNDREASAYVTPSSLLRHEDDACFVLEPMFWPAAPPEARLDINDPMLLEVSLHLPVTSSVATAGGSGMEVTRAAPTQQQISPPAGLKILRAHPRT
jgi:hypothetical protein